MASSATAADMQSETTVDRTKSTGSAGEMVNLSIRTLDKKEFHLQVGMHIGVKALKTQVAAATSIAVESQRLMSSGKEMADDSQLSDYSKAPNQVIYLVVRFPGATFAVPSQEVGESELPTTVGEESMLRSSRIVLRGTVTIPVPERDMHRVVHRILHRGPGTPNLQELVSSMSYLPRYRRAPAEGEGGGPGRRGQGAALGHRRRRRRRAQQQAEALPLELRAHAVRGEVGAAGLEAAGEAGLGEGSWSDYIDLELHNSLLPDPFQPPAAAFPRHDAYLMPHDTEGVLDDIHEEEAEMALNPHLYSRDGSERGLYGSYGGEADDGYEVGGGSARATMMAAGTGESSASVEGEGAELPIGSMAGKRKHSQICGDAVLEHRLATRCRNLTLEGDGDERSESGEWEAGASSRETTLESPREEGAGAALAAAELLAVLEEEDQRPELAAAAAGGGEEDEEDEEDEEAEEGVGEVAWEGRGSWRSVLPPAPSPASSAADSARPPLLPPPRASEDPIHISALPLPAPPLLLPASASASRPAEPSPAELPRALSAGKAAPASEPAALRLPPPADPDPREALPKPRAPSHPEPSLAPRSHPDPPPTPLPADPAPAPEAVYKLHPEQISRAAAPVDSVDAGAPPVVTKSNPEELQKVAKEVRVRKNRCCVVM